MENRFAAARRRYLRTHIDGIYTGMLLTGTLEPHLKEIGESAQAMFDRIVEQMKKAEGVKMIDELRARGRVPGFDEEQLLRLRGGLEHGRGQGGAQLVK